MKLHPISLRTILKKVLFAVLLLCSCNGASAWPGMAMPRLHVDGRYLKDTQGNIVNLHGFAQTYSPYFNELGTRWTNYNVSGCLRYNQGLIDSILSRGWKMNFMRLHMDPYWSNKPGVTTKGESDISAFSMERFKAYLYQVFIPMAEYAAAKGLYVIMRPPGVCPDTLRQGDAYQKYLLQVWSYVARQPRLCNNAAILYELANEPVTILGSNGQAGSAADIKRYFQPVVDTLRSICDNVVLVPGTGYQSQYAAYGECPIEGTNVGYAVHVYPGWFNSGTGYDAFQRGWDAQVKPVADIAPVVVTEMDWAPAKYNASWGKDSTGVAGGTGFGANFKKITDDAGNVSWLLFTEAWRLAQFRDVAPAEGEALTFLTDPQACPWPCYHWFAEYAGSNFPRPDFTYRSTSDNGDGTYTNPVIQADFPDPDIVRVGDVYYYVSTTMHNFPGCTLLRSHDLVNWEYCCNPLTKLSNNADYNLENNTNVYSKGSWACSLMYRGGKFHILFNVFGRGDDAGGYVLTATNAEGPWTLRHIATGYYDPGLLADDDGKMYVACGNTDIHVMELDDDFNTLSDHTVATGQTGMEGNHFYKIDGRYYIYNTAFTDGSGKQWCLRASSPFGPYEIKQIFNCNDIHQGALVQTPKGAWWTVLMRDCGAFGRMPYLEPVSWVDGWPVIGTSGKDVGTHAKPDVGRQYAAAALPTTDNFRSYILGKQWQWNHNPDNTRWSLLERPGYLRLRTACVTDSFQQARNTLTQRIFAYHSDTIPSYGTVRLDLRGMADGDVTGLCVFQDPYAYIGVSRSQGAYSLVWRSTAVKADASQPLAVDSVIYLRAVADVGTSKARFFYSLNGTDFLPFGQTLDMKYQLTVFVGNRFCIFNYATKALGGYVDVDWFTTERRFDETTFYGSTYAATSTAALTAASLQADRSAYTVLSGGTRTLGLTATYLDGHTADVSAEAAYTFSPDSIVSIAHGRLTSLGEGSTLVTATYTDPLGHALTATFTATVAMFPFTDDAFDPSIYATGTFDATTLALRTGQYGFGGWHYTSGLDLSPYRYLVVQLAAVQQCGASLRLFDTDNYWSTPYTYDFGTKTKIIVSLHSMKKGSTTTLADPSHIYLAGFWTNGSAPLMLKSVYVSNDGVTPTGIDAVLEPNAADTVNVCTLSGQRLRCGVPRGSATQGLPAGVYIVGHRCIAVSR
jgi:beta-xylosidase